jgi:NitT/TauT family transport system ATP-binding protein
MEDGLKPIIEPGMQLADRVVVMSQRPARIQAIIPVPLVRPRDLDSPNYLAIRDEIFRTMGMDFGRRAPRADS